ncbi:MAG: hypothetical protein C4334_01880 [Pyrinomonas sp.]
MDATGNGTATEVIVYLFRIGASFTGQLKASVEPEEARDFFDDPRTFTELMPNVESVTVRPDGTRRWTIRAEVPLLGAMRVSFTVRRATNKPHALEWEPLPEEKQNFLRYSAAFATIETGTLVRFIQSVELRRQRAADLHGLAGWLGANRISRELQLRLTETMNVFLQRARAKLERIS